MFESILEGLLNKYLGEYVEGLGRDDLSLSIWGGDIKLTDVNLKKDIFEKLKLPLNLVFGKIGYLRIQVPWRSLGSQPVIVEVKNVWLVVEPKTDSSKWENVETLETSFEKKEELVREIAKELFEEMIKSVEEKKKEQGMMASMVTKIVDNLQISLEGLHVRVEHEDTIAPQNSFSLGLTLQKLDLYTTDDQWNRIYIDRTKQVNKAKAMYKLLQVTNYGVYYKTKEMSLISQAHSEEEKFALLQMYAIFDEKGRVSKQADDYLVSPLTLQVKLIQNDPTTAMMGQLTLMNLYVGLEEFSITIQKGQYDNVQMLLELTNDYMRFLTSESLICRKTNLGEMNRIVKESGNEVTKKSIQKLYKDIFAAQFDVVQAADPKKPEKLKQSLDDALVQGSQKELYEAIVLGINCDDLKIWAKEVITDKAQEYQRQKAVKQQQKSKGLLSRMWGGSKEQSEEEKQQQLDKIEEEINERAKQLNAMTGNSEQRKNIADIRFEFNLKRMNLTLINDVVDYKGVTLSAEDLSVGFNKYDGTNKYNSKTIDLDIGLGNYGLYVIYKEAGDQVNYSPFVQKLMKVDVCSIPTYQSKDGDDDEFFDAHEEESKENLVALQSESQQEQQLLTKIYFALGNKEHHESDLAHDQIDETDLEVQLHMRPIEIIFRAETVGDIQRFFKVKKLTEKTKLAAQAQYQQLTSSVNEISQSLNKDFQNNKISIKVEKPTLVIPFQQKTWQEIVENEAWVFTMGDVGLNSYTGAGFEVDTHEAFQLKVERVKFEHVNGYCKWKESVDGQPVADAMVSSALPDNGSMSPLPSPILLQQDSARDSDNGGMFQRKVTFDKQTKKLRVTKLLEDFTTSVLLLKKRSEQEMMTPEMLEALKRDQSPGIEIKAQFDDEMKFSLRPAVFQKLTKIGTLMSEPPKKEHYYKNKMLKKLKVAQYHGQVRVVGLLGGLISGTAAIIEPRNIYFWPDNLPQNMQVYDLSGCEDFSKKGFQINGLNMIFSNSVGTKLEFSFENLNQRESWTLQVIETLQKLSKMKHAGSDITESQLKLPTSTSELLDVATPALKGAQEDKPVEQSDFGLTFTVPKVVLILKTRKMIISKKIKGESNEWTLNTELEKITFNMRQAKGGLKVNANVTQLKVTDNSSDDRFPFIFQNMPVEGQQDLATFALKTVDKTSPDFTDCETYVNLGFSGLVAYWKPQAMLNLLEFINSNNAAANAPRPKTDQDDQLDAALKQTLIERGSKDKSMQQREEVKLQESEEHQREHKGCIDKPFFSVKVNVKLAYLTAIFIHPDNNTYPIFSIEVKETTVDYWKKCDHDQINLKVKNLQVFDNTSYPDTINPAIEYTAEAEVQQREIMGLNTAGRELADEDMLSMSAILFQFPSMNRCALQLEDARGQPSHVHNMSVKMNLQQMRLIFMMEQTLRIVDYSMNCIAKLFNTGLDNADFMEDTQTEDDLGGRAESMVSEMISEMESLDIESETGLDDEFWGTFDLKQEPYCPKLDLHLSCPLIIMPNLQEPTERFELDFGTIQITSKQVHETMRWVNHPDKPIRSMQVTVQNNDLRFDFKKDGYENSFKPILKEDTVFVNVVIPNASPFFEEKNERGAHTKAPVPIDSQGRTFDMDQVDTSVNVSIKQSLLKLHLKQDVIIELFNTLEHNVLSKDKFSNEFNSALTKRKATIMQQTSVQARKRIVTKKLTNKDDDGLSDDEGDAKKFQLKKKTLQLTVQSSCLSIELRKADDSLIAEFCMVNFDLSNQIFQDGIQRMVMTAYSFFIFHDEDPITNTKQVMFGHINASNEMVTTDDFYHTLPEKIRLENFGKGGADITKRKQKIRFEMTMDPNTKTNTMKVDLSKLKFYIRPQVFMDISEFTIACLRKLDLKKEQQDSSPVVVETDDSDPMNDSFLNPVKGTSDDRGTTSKIEFKMQQSILVLERREFQKKAAVLQLGVSVKMTNHDPRAIERRIGGQKLRHTGSSKARFQAISEMSVKVESMTPYIINVKDLETTKFKQVKKRALINPFDLDLKMESYVAQANANVPAQRKNTGLLDPTKRIETTQPKPVMKFKQRNLMESRMTQIFAQVSMDDLYVVQQLAQKANDESMEVLKMWQDYQESSITTESDKMRKLEQDIISEDAIQFELEGGSDIVIINEDKGNFVPMFLFSTEPVTFNQTSGVNQEDKSDGNADTKCSLYYFNALKGHWEPAIEAFSLKVQLMRVGKQSSQTVLINDPININVSVYLGRVINDFMKLWDKSVKRSQLFQKKMAVGNESAFARSSIMTRSRETLLGSNNVMLMDTQEALTDFVTPYAIKNLTDRTLKVTSLKQSSGLEDNVCKIGQGEMKGLAVSYTDTLNMSEKDENDRKKVTSKDQFVRMSFDSKSMRPIQRFKLNQNCDFVKHKVFQDVPRDKIKRPNLNREYYVIQNKLENQRRVLTVRTQHVLTNMTKTTYKVKQFFVNKIVVDGKPKKENVIFYKADLPPGESIPLPDDRDEEIVEKLKICLRPIDCKKWSDEFKISALKEKLKPDLNIMWNHYKTYSILRKEQTEYKGVFNYLLLPALIIKNCLPMAIMMTLSQEQKTEEERKANMRTELNDNITKNRILSTEENERAELNKIKLGDYAFQRDEEMVLDTISSQASSIDIVLNIENRNFRGQVLRIQQANAALDTEEVILFRDSQNRSFKIYARIDTSRAGNKVVIYAKNVLLCHTEQSIEFFYQKKTDIFEADNAHEFPLPVRDNRSRAITLNTTVVTDRGNQGSNEPTIYIHNEENTMCAALTGAEEVKSNLVPINTPGSTGKFDVPYNGMLYQFQCSTATYQPSEKESVFTRMVEVSPQYIVCNLTSQDIFFSQSHVTKDQYDFVMLLKPKDRQPFHWSDKDKPQTVKFYVEGATQHTAPFTLADCGSVAVTNVTMDGAKDFFQVTKRIVLNSTFIIIESMENAPYKIDNKSADLYFDYFQVGAKTAEEVETCRPGEHRPYAWREVIITSSFMLNMSFYHRNQDGDGDQDILVPFKPQDPKRPEVFEISLDILNRTTEVVLVNKKKQKRTLYVSVYTNEYSKVLEVTDFPSTNIFQTDKDRKRMQQADQIQNLQWNESVDFNSSVQLTTIGEDENNDESKEENRTKLDIRQVNISLINKQVEVMTIVLDQWLMMMKQDRQEWIYEGVLQRIQIDNHGQSQPLFPVILKPKCTYLGKHHKHFLSPEDKEKIEEQKKEESKEAAQSKKEKKLEVVEPTFQIYTSIKTNIPNVQYINLFEFLLKELELKIELEHLMSIFEWQQAFNQSFDAGLASSHQIFNDTSLTTEMKSADQNGGGNKVMQLNESARDMGRHMINTGDQPVKPKKSVRFVANAADEERKKHDIDDTIAIEQSLADAADSQDDVDPDEEARKQLKTWRSNLITENMDTVYIEQFKGSPLMIEISIFKQTRANDQPDNKKRSGMLDLLGNLGLQFTNITGAPMQLNALEIANVYGSQNVIKGLLLEHYSSNIRSNFLKFIGSTDLLGNPTDFVNTLGTGAKQFYYAPREGFMQGPLQGGLGIIKGTGSLMAHTLGGVSGSVSKMTNTLNRGFLYLSADTEYRQQKEIRDIKEKPTGVLDGMGKGAKGLGRSIWGGVSGIVTQPFKGAKEDGIAGFGKGVGKGLLGTVVKPISGVVDLVSKTTEGVESAVDGGICKENNLQMRPSRPFYQTAGIFRTFSEIHAVLHAELRDTQKPENVLFASSSDIFYGAFKLGAVVDPMSQKLDQPMIMITETSLVRFTIEQGKLKLDWVIKTEDMVLPKKDSPNPAIDDHTLTVHLKNNQMPKVLDFANERVALIVADLFADMFYTKKAAQQNSK